MTFFIQVVSDFDEMKKLIARLHVSLDEEDEENEAFLERYCLYFTAATLTSASWSLSPPVPPTGILSFLPDLCYP